MAVDALIASLMIACSLDGSLSEFVKRTHMNLTSVPLDISENATDINLSWNLLSYIGLNAFVNCTKPTHIDMSHNNIYYLHPNAMNGTSSLLNVELSHNNLSSVPYLENLQLFVLSLAFNPITELDLCKLLSTYKSLEYFILSYATLSVVTFNCSDIEDVKANSALIVFNLGVNKIAKLDAGTFSNMKSLKDVNLGTNQLKNFDCGVVNGTIIDHLALKENQLTEAPDLSCVASTMREVDLSKNKINYVDYGSLQKLERLELLDLRDNQLTILSEVSGICDFLSTRSYIQFADCFMVARFSDI
jgi:Leucine-rich repeat (LRR) protein